MADILGTDEFLVNRNDVTYTQEQATLMANLENDDLLLVNRADKTYKLTGEELIDSVIDPLQVTVFLSPRDGYTDVEVTANAVASGGKAPDGGYTFTYQWFTADDSAGTNKVAIPGATDKDFTPTDDQLDKTLRCEATTTDALGTTETGSDSIGPIQELSQPPVISTVVIDENYDGANRFTNKEFPYVTTMAIDGNPNPEFAVKAKLSGTTFDFNLMSDVITAVEGGGENTCQTGTIASVEESSLTNAVVTAAWNGYGGNQWPADITWDGLGASDDFGELNGTAGTGGTETISTPYTAAIGDFGSGDRGGNGWALKFEQIVSIEFNPVATARVIACQSTSERVDQGTVYYSPFPKIMTGQVFWLQCSGLPSIPFNEINGAGFTLEFDSNDGFDCFERDDIVQTNSVQRQDYSDGIIAGTPAQAGTTWDKAFDGKIIIGDVNGVYNLAATNFNDTYNLLFPEPEPINESIQFVYMNENTGEDGLIKVVTNSGTVEFSDASLPNTATDSQQLSQVFSTAFLGDPASILGFELTGGSAGWVGIAGVYIDGKLLTNVSDTPEDAVKVISKDPDSTPATISVDGGKWKGADGSGDQADGEDKLVKVTPYDTTLTVNSDLNLSDLAAMADKSVMMTNGSSPISQTAYKLVTSQITNIDNTDPNSIVLTFADPCPDLQYFKVGDEVQETVFKANSLKFNLPGFTDNFYCEGVYLDGKLLWDSSNFSGNTPTVDYIEISNATSNGTSNASKWANGLIDGSPNGKVTDTQWRGYPNAGATISWDNEIEFKHINARISQGSADDFIGGRIELVDGTLVATFDIPGSTADFHDVDAEPAGKVKVIAPPDVANRKLTVDGGNWFTGTSRNYSDEQYDLTAGLGTWDNVFGSDENAFMQWGADVAGTTGSPDAASNADGVVTAYFNPPLTGTFAAHMNFADASDASFSADADSVGSTPTPIALDSAWNDYSFGAVTNLRSVTVTETESGLQSAIRYFSLDGNRLENTSENAENHIEYQTNGGQGEIVSVDTVNNKIEVSNTGTRNNRWIAGNSGEGSGTSTDFFVAPETPVVIEQDSAWGKLNIENNQALVTGIQLEEPQFTPVASRDYTIKFPAQFASGNAPDTDLPSGVAISAIVEAKNSEGRDEKESNAFIPQDVNPSNAAGPIVDSTSTTLQMSSNANFDSFSVGNDLEMINDQGQVDNYTMETSAIETIVSVGQDTTLTYGDKQDGGAAPGNTATISQIVDGDLTTQDGYHRCVQTSLLFNPTPTVNSSLRLYVKPNSASSVGEYFVNNTNTGVAVPSSTTEFTWVDIPLDSFSLPMQLDSIGATNNVGVEAEGASIFCAGIEVDGVLLGADAFSLTFDDPCPDLKFFRVNDIVQTEPTFGGKVTYTTTPAGVEPTLLSGDPFKEPTGGTDTTATIAWDGLVFGVSFEFEQAIDPSTLWGMRGGSYGAGPAGGDFDYTLHVYTIDGTEYTSPVLTTADYWAIVPFSWEGGLTPPNIKRMYIDVPSGNGVAFAGFGTGPLNSDMVPVGSLDGSILPNDAQIKALDVDNRKMTVSGGTWISTDSPLEGRRWSNHITTTGNNGNFLNKEYIFDDNLMFAAHANGDGGDCVVTFIIDPPLSVNSKVSYWGSIESSDVTDTSAEWNLNDDAATSVYTNGGGNGGTPTAPNGRISENVINYSGELSKITITKTSTNNSGGIYIAGFSIDDTLLVEADADGQAVVTFGPVTGTAKFASHDNTDTITVTDSNDRWIDNTNRLSTDFYARVDLGRGLYANNPRHVAMQQAIADAFAAFPVKVNERRTAIASSFYRLMAGETLSNEEFTVLEDTVIDAVNATEPFALDGYYPLYYTSAKADAASSSNSHHTHTIDGIDYYMPDGGTIYHGNYTG